MVQLSMFIQLLMEGHPESTHGKNKPSKGIQLESTDDQLIIKHR